MSCHTKEELENMLQDVVNELPLDDYMIAKHGRLGTDPAVLVKEVLEDKNRTIGSERYKRKLQVEELEQELAKLRAKAEAYDKGQTMWMSFDADTNEPYAVDKDVTVVTHDTWKLLGRHPQGNMPGGFVKRRVRIVEVVGL